MNQADLQFPLLRSWLRAFYSKAFYRDLSVRYSFWGIVHWSVLFFIILACASVILTMRLMYSRTPEMLAMIRHFPTVHIEQDHIQIGHQLPHQIAHPNQKGQWLVEFVEQPHQQHTAKFVVTPKQIWVKNSSGHYEQIDTKALAGVTISNGLIQKIYDHALIILFTLCLPTVWLAGSMLAACCFVFVSIGTSILARFLGKNFSFKRAYRLTVFASIPVLVLKSIYLLLPITIPYVQALWLLLFLGYLQFAVSHG